MLNYANAGSGDARLFAAEQRAVEVRAQLAALYNTPGLLTFENETALKDPLLDAEGAELDFIHLTPAATLAGAAVKLRGLLDEQYLLDGDDALCVSVRQVLELVERLVGESDGAEFIAAEREIGEADRLAGAASGDADFGPIHDRYDAATDFVEATEPRSLVAVAVKLRRLLRRDGPLAGDERERDSLEQSVSFLERVMAAADSRARDAHDDWRELDSGSAAAA